MKKLIALSLIILFPSLIGCSYYVIDKEEFLNQEENKDIKILLADLNEYYFDDDNYFVENDTLKGSIEIKGEDDKYEYKEVQIPLDEIKVYSIKGARNLNTYLLASGMIAIVVYLLVWVIFD